MSEPSPSAHPADGQVSGTTLADRYTLEQRLAVGGMGEVWRGRDVVLERHVAIKLPRPDLAGELGFREQFWTEARHAAALTHPRVATVFDYGAGDGDIPFLVMELVDGPPLSAQIARGPLTVQQTASLIRDVASALAAAHAQALLHRDIKPGNLLIRPDGSVAVTDFGISRAAGAAASTRAGELRGTAQYVSPEQAAGQPAGPASDVYALGVVAYECLTGHRPFDGEPIHVLTAKRDQPPPPLPEHIPTWIREVVMSMLDPAPSRRPAARDLAELDSSAPSATFTSVDSPTATAVLPAYTMAPPLGTDPDAPAPGDSAAESPVGRARDTANRPKVTAAALALQARATFDRGRTWWGQHPERRGAILAAGIATVLALVVIVALAPWRGTARSTAGGAVAHGRPAALHAVRAVSAALFHPGGSDSDHPGDVPLSADGRLDTAWQTQHYATATFGNLRPGVGVVYDLGRPVAVLQIRLNLNPAGEAVQVRAGNDMSNLLQVHSVLNLNDAPAVVDRSLAQPVVARYWLVWFSRLPEGGSHQAGIAEAQFLTR